MTLTEEYKAQNDLREWKWYLNKLPLNSDQVVYDLGCSIGAVSKLFAPSVRKVVGFDYDASLLAEAGKQKPENCEFIKEDISKPLHTGKCDGIWLSFTLAYIKEPELFLANWLKCLSPGGWLAIADIDGLFSNHLANENKYFEDIASFEKASGKNGIYDFRAGRKIKKLMEQAGLEIIVEENDWYDRELNFKGSASPEIVRSWQARLERMVSLKSFFGEKYTDFHDCFIDALKLESHTMNGGVRYYAGIKTNECYNKTMGC